MYLYGDNNDNNDVERELREFAKDKGKGAISKVIEDALRLYFSRMKVGEKVFRAYIEDELVAEASNLEDLARILKEKRIDPRNVVIVSLKSIKPVARMDFGCSLMERQF